MNVPRPELYPTEECYLCGGNDATKTICHDCYHQNAALHSRVDELKARVAELEQGIHFIVESEDKILLYENGTISCPICRRELDPDYDGNYVEGHSIGCIWVSFCNLLDKGGAE